MNRALASALLDLDADALFVVDAQARIVLLNAAAEDLIGQGLLSRERLLLSSPHPALAAEISARIALAATTASSDPAELKPPRSLGATSLSMAVTRLDGGPSTRLLVRMKDTATALRHRCAAFARSHDLTAKDERLLLALAQDVTLQDYCRRESLPIWTESRRLHRLYRIVGRPRLSSLLIAVLSGEGPEPLEPQALENGLTPNAVAVRTELSTRSPSAPLPAGAPRPPLPSFTGLKAFEAFVRLGSMTAAALELRTFPSNISRHISKLEATTGLSLTHGSRAAVRPTQAGLHLASAAAAAFDLVHAAAPHVTLTPREASSFVRAQQPGRAATHPGDLAGAQLAAKGRRPSQHPSRPPEKGLPSQD